MKRLVLAAIALAAAFAIGRATRTSASQPTATERVIEHRPIETRITEGVNLDDVRAIVREELARGQVTQPAREPDAPPVPGDLAAFDRARAAVDSGLADGHWTTEDRARLRSELVTLDQDQLEVVLKSLVTAINDGRVRVDLHGPPV